MTKILSFLILSIFEIVSFSHNLVMAKTDLKHSKHSIHIIKENHCNSSKSHSEKCLLECLKKIELEKSISSNSHIKEKTNIFTFKFLESDLNLNLYFIGIQDKSFYRINSPPFLKDSYKDYSYKNLIIIIKSNT